MSERNLKRVRLTSIIIFLLGAVTLGLAYSVKKPSKKYAPVGFTMITRQIFTSTSDRVPHLHAIQVRYQKSNGNWKQITTTYGKDGTTGNIDVGFGLVGRGVFRVFDKGKALSFVGPAAEPAQISPDALRTNPQFIREEVVLGYQTFVMRLSDQSEGFYTELYRAPALMGLTIKTVFSSPGGVDMIEPISIEVREPSDEVLTVDTNVPVKYDYFEKKIRTFEEQGNYDLASKLRQEMQQLRENRQ